MILIPNDNIDAHRNHPQHAAWLAILAEHGTQTDRGWEVPWQAYNAVSAARRTGVYDAVKHPAPELPPEPVRAARVVAPITDRRSGGRGCSGCGGSSAVNATGDPAAINAVLTE